MHGFKDLTRLDMQKTGFSVHRDVLENGVRVVTFQDVSPEYSIEQGDIEDIADGVIVIEDMEDVPLIQNLDQCIQSLEQALGESDGRLTDTLQDAVIQTSHCLHAKIRGVCQTSGEIRPLMGDGIVYIPFEKSEGASCLRQTVDFILEQLNAYAKSQE